LFLKTVAKIATVLLFMKNKDNQKSKKEGKFAKNAICLICCFRREGKKTR